MKQHLLRNKAVVNEAIRRYGTPTYIYFKDRLIGNLERISGTIRSDYPETEVYLSAFTIGSNPLIMKILRENDCKVMVTSPASLFMSLKAGFESDEISYVASSMSEQDIRYVSDRKIFTYFDSANQLRFFSDASEMKACGLRVRLDVDPPNSKDVWASAVGKNSRIGVEEKQLSSILKYGHELGLDITSLHVYAGSNVMDCTKLLDIAEHFSSLIIKNIGHLHKLISINFGGGFGFDYEHYAAFDFRSYSQGMRRVLERLNRMLGRKDKGIKAIVEPGRSLFADAAVLATEITDIRSYGNWNVVGCDASCAIKPRTMMYGTKNKISILNKENMPDEIEITLVGPTTFSNDILTLGVRCAPVEIGDVILIHDVGAYEDAMRGEFLQQLKPPVLLIDGNVIRIARERETIEEHAARWNWSG